MAVAHSLLMCQVPYVLHYGTLDTYMCHSFFSLEKKELSSGVYSCFDLPCLVD